MSVVSRSREEIEIDHKRPASIVALTALLGILVIGALQGGIAMVTDPLQPLGMSISHLEGTPVDDYFWPGVFLLGIAAASLITIAGLVFGWKWEWASRIEGLIGHSWPWLGALSIGGVLLVFEIIELFFVPFHPVMHPLLIAESLVIVWIALTPSARRFLDKKAGENVTIWVVPEAGHIQGLASAPDAWEREVIGFLDGVPIGD